MVTRQQNVVKQSAQMGVASLQAFFRSSFRLGHCLCALLWAGTQRRGTPHEQCSRHEEFGTQGSGLAPAMQQCKKRSRPSTQEDHGSHNQVGWPMQSAPYLQCNNAKREADQAFNSTMVLTVKLVGRCNLHHTCNATMQKEKQTKH